MTGSTDISSKEEKDMTDLLIEYGIVVAVSAIIGITIAIIMDIIRRK